MEIVVDTSAIIAVITGEPERDKLIKLTKGAILLAPESVYWEIGNAFSAMLKRRRTTLDKVKNALAVFEEIPIRYIQNVELDKSLEIANEANIYCYDAYLIRCCIRYKAPLLSLDKKLVEVAKNMSINVLEV